MSQKICVMFQRNMRSTASICKLECMGGESDRETEIGRERVCGKGGKVGRRKSVIPLQCNQIWKLIFETAFAFILLDLS